MKPQRDYSVVTAVQGSLGAPEGEDNTAGFAGMTLVLRSMEWTRRGGCQADQLGFTMNGKSLISKVKSTSVCDIPQMHKTQAPYSGWNEYDGTYAVWEGSPNSIETCPDSVAYTYVGKRYDFVISLKGSGDRKAPTVLYVGKGSIDSSWCD
jgi:hypothetical protein